jgi:hypothetical protein
MKFLLIINIIINYISLIFCCSQKTRWPTLQRGKGKIDFGSYAYNAHLKQCDEDGGETRCTGGPN